MPGALQSMLRNAGSALTVSVTPGGLFKQSSTSPITTGTATGAVSGGVAPYTFSWSAVGDDGVTITPTSPNTASSAFRADVPLGMTYTGTATLTVTDSLGQVAVSNAITLTFDRPDYYL